MDVKSCYGAVLMAVMRTAGKDAAKKFDTWLRFRRKVDLKNPRTMRDKVIYIENHCPSPLAPLCTDKWEVRSYVAEKGYAGALIPVCGGAYSAFDQIPFHSFPDRFVLKAAHGCNMNYFCDSKANLDLDDCRRTVEKWLCAAYGAYSGEWHYLDIPRRIYCEQYLGGVGELADYKFHCMNGVPQYILVCRNRNLSGRKGAEESIFDLEWNSLPGLREENPVCTPPPACLGQMVEMAKTLSADFKFVRVDLYEKDGRVYFGELTFTPACGVFPQYTDQFLEEMGRRLRL